MAHLSENRMNVAALKRVDPYVRDLLETAAHVALYSFNAEDNEWEKTDVEGALFVYSRTGEPFHNILIMNRLNTNNFVEPVTQGLDLHLQDPFLLYRTTRGSIFCIWFYDKDECSRIGAALDKLVKETCQNQEKKIEKKNTIANSIGVCGNVDIFSMLSKAQEEYNSSNKSSGKNPEAEPGKSKEPDNTPKSVKEFFIKASQFNNDKTKQPAMYGIRSNVNWNRTDQYRPPPGLNPIPVQMGLPPQNPLQGDVKPILQRLMSNPAHSVEHIEKQQRSITPQSELAALMRNSKVPKDVKLNNAKKVASSASIIDNKQTGGVKPPTVQTQIENGMGFLRISEASLSPVTNTVVQTQNFFNTNLNKHSPANIDAEQRCLSAPHGVTPLENAAKPALMPPVMFTSTSTVKEEPNNSVPVLGIQPAIPKVEPLTKNQLLQAVNYLLKNDPDFIQKIHEAYVKSFSELVS